MLRPLIVCGLIVPIVWGSLTGRVQAERPIASQLLPDSTLVYLRVADARLLRERFPQTALGRMLNDAQMQPLLGQLYGSLLEGYERVEQRVGLPLERLLDLPQGEICLAVVPPAEGPPQLVFWFDAGDRITDARQLLDRLEDEVLAGGGSKTSDAFEDTRVTVLQPPGGRSRRVAIVEKDGVVLFSTETGLAKQLLAVWTGRETVRSLADDRRFTAIMSRCQGDPQDPPQISWFVDPIELLRRTGRGNFSTQAGLAILGGLGIDGLQAAGGSITFATEQFDSISEAHVLLQTPRHGVLRAIALDLGDVTPESWAPADVAAYLTLNWDLRQTYNELVRLHDIFQGEGAWQNRVLEDIRRRTDINLERDVIDAVTGRFSLLTWIEKPARWNSQASMLGVKLKDPAASRTVLEKLATRFPDRLQKEAYGGTVFYRLPSRGRNQQVDQQALRVPEPCAAIVNDYFLITDSVKLMYQAISAKDSAQPLAQELDYKLIASKISRRLGEQKAGMVSFSRPEEGLRNIYEMVNSATVRNQLGSRAANNPAFRALNDALTQNPLPPFSVLAQYLSPGGSMIVNDETGFHYTGFSLRREQP